MSNINEYVGNVVVHYLHERDDVIIKLKSTLKKWQDQSTQNNPGVLPCFVCCDPVVGLYDHSNYRCLLCKNAWCKTCNGSFVYYNEDCDNETCYFDPNKPEHPFFITSICNICMKAPSVHKLRKGFPDCKCIRDPYESEVGGKK